MGIAHTFNSLSRVVNAHSLTPHCIPQIMLATFKVRKYFWVVSLVTGALALTVRVISIVWLDSHFPSAPSDFFAANFVLRISQFRAVQSCFAHLVFAIFSASAIIRELWVALHLPLIMCHNAAGLCSHEWLCGCSAHAWLLSLFCLYYFSAQRHETCLNEDLFSNSKSLNGQ